MSFWGCSFIVITARPSIMKYTIIYLSIPLKVSKWVSEIVLPTRPCLIPFWTPRDYHKSWHAGGAQEISAEWLESGKNARDDQTTAFLQEDKYLSILDRSESSPWQPPLRLLFIHFSRQIFFSIYYVPSIVLEINETGASPSSKELSYMYRSLQGKRERDFYKDCVEWEKKT